MAEPTTLERKEELIVKEVLEFCDDTRAARRAQEADWMLCAAFYAGQQRTYLDSASGRLRDIPLGRHVLWVQRNIIWPAVRYEVAYLTRGQRTLECLPRVANEEAEASVKVAQKVVDYLDRELDLPAALAEIAQWCVITGNAFLKIVWDPEGGERLTLPQDDEEDPAQPRRTIGTGEIALVPLTPFELLLDPEARRWSEMSAVVDCRQRSVTYAKRRWPKLADVIGPDEDSKTTYQRQVKALVSGNVRSDTGASDKNRLTVYEQWVWPCREYPGGLRRTVVGKRLAEEKPLPYNALSGQPQVPIVPFRFGPPLGGYYCKGLVSDAVPINTDLNRHLTRVLTNLRLMGGGKWLVSRQARLAQKAITSEPGEVIFYDGMLKPEVVWPTVPVGPEMAYRQALIEDFMGVIQQREISQGRTPPGVSSGIAISYLQERDDAPRSTSVAYFDQSVAQVASQMLARARQFYTEPRTAVLAGGPGGSAGVAEFRGEDLNGVADVICLSGSGMPRSKAAMTDLAMQLYDRGVFGPPGTPQAGQALIHALQFPIPDEVLQQLGATAAEAPPGSPESIQQALQDPQFHAILGQMMQQQGMAAPPEGGVPQ